MVGPWILGTILVPYNLKGDIGTLLIYSVLSGYREWISTPPSFFPSVLSTEKEKNDGNNNNDNKSWSKPSLL